MDLGISGKTAVVTGAGRGIGRAIASALAREGVKVALISRTLSELEDLAAEIAAQGGAAAPFPCDVTSRPQVADLAEAVTARFGPAEILVNNAATRADYARVETVGDVAFDTTLRENLESIYSVCKAFVPPMKEAAWGRVVNIGSLVGEIGGHGQAAYATAKAGLVGFTRSLALEYCRSGITVNLVVPGTIDTERVAGVLSDKARDLILLRTAVKRLGTPEEVAAAVAFLASAQAAFITGISLHVTGGYELNFG